MSKIFTEDQRDELTQLAEGRDEAAHAKAHAVTSPEGLSKLFDRLKSKQVVWMAYSAVMGRGSKEYRPYTVGRRSHSKKYNVTSVRLMPGKGAKPSRGMKISLMRRSDGGVRVALGDMGATLVGIYVEK